MIDPAHQQLITQTLRQQWPETLAIYVFGSQINGTATPQSDLDLAILVPGYSDPVERWDTAQALAITLDMDIDLLDFRRSSTVMQYQILTHGQRWWQKDNQAELFEAAVLNDKLKLDEARAPLIGDILQQGTIYG